MKNDPFALALLFDYYGELLTERQRLCFDLSYNQDLSLSEIAEVVGISRQGVHDCLSRAEAALRSMEEKTGCAARDFQARQTAGKILRLAEQLLENEDNRVSGPARQIAALARSMKE